VISDYTMTKTSDKVRSTGAERLEDSSFISYPNGLLMYIISFQFAVMKADAVA
jgi:hypothetical protein